LLNGGIPEAEYYGQTVWNGEKLVTTEEWKNSLPNSSPVDMQRRWFFWNGKTHRLVSFALVFAGTGHLLLAFVAMRGSTFIDQIEESFLSPTWAKKHRKGTHYWAYYMVPIFLCAASVGIFCCICQKKLLLLNWQRNHRNFLFDWLFILECGFSLEPCCI